MYYEYAVDPHVIAGSWESCRYWSEKFGFDKGRLISDYPNNWYNEVKEAFDNSKANLSQMDSVKLEERLVLLGKEIRRKALFRNDRHSYDKRIGWLENAIKMDNSKPFHAIVSTASQSEHSKVLGHDEVHASHSLMNIPTAKQVIREAGVLADAIAPLIQSSSRIIFIDPYFDILKPPYQNTLIACLKRARQNHRSTIECKIHYSDKVNPDVQKRSGNSLQGIVPEDMTVKLYQWKEKEFGADFHARYLLTDLGGVNVEAGFEEQGRHQKVEVKMLDYAYSQGRIKEFDPKSKSPIYTLLGDVLEIDSSGNVKTANN